MRDMVTTCDVTSHRIEGGATDEAFQEQCFLRERGSSADVVFLSFKNLYNTLKKRKKKHNRSHFNINNIFVNLRNVKSSTNLM